MLQSVCFVLPYVLCCQIQQFTPVAACSNVYAYIITYIIRQERHQYIFRPAVQQFTQCRYAVCQQFLSALVQLALALQRAPLYDTAVVYVQHVDVYLVILLVVAEHVQFADGGVRYNGL